MSKFPAKQGWPCLGQEGQGSQEQGQETQELATSLRYLLRKEQKGLGNSEMKEAKIQINVIAAIANLPFGLSPTFL